MTDQNIPAATLPAAAFMPRAASCGSAAPGRAPYRVVHPGALPQPATA